jgi:alpha-mannosidase
MERYPEFQFSCSQPQLYAYTKEHFPTLYEEIKHWVREGRWGTTGGMWVEADCNITSGESLIRQILFGKRFFREEFGTQPTSCWLPDVFGYTASLPQILQGCGLNSIYTCKLHWQARNPFPCHLFWWQGVDGTRVLAHIPLLRGMYNGNVQAEQLNYAWSQFKEKAAYDEMMFTFGYGDGGGGVTEGMLEYAERLKHYPGLPACRQDMGEAYLEKVHADLPELPNWQGELYVETHRGTYTSQAAVKRANRRNELLLREAEIAGVLSTQLGKSIDLNPLRGAWEKLLLHQFHDDLPGSSIGAVYVDALRDYRQVEKTAQSIRDVAIDAIAASAPAADLFVFNSLSWERSDLIEATIVSPAGPLEAVDPEGRAVPVQVTARSNEHATIVFAPTAVPAVGYTTFALRPPANAPESSLVIGAGQMENRFFTIELDEFGQITRLLDKRCQREVIPPGQTANCLQLFQDGPEDEAAWNIHDTFDRREYPFEGATTVEAIESGPVRGGVRVTRHHRSSRIEQDIIIYDTIARIDFVTRVDWQERQVLLKAAFPVEVLADQATFEIQFGALQRATHRNTSWEQEKFEVPAQRWADLSEGGYGVSLMNDCKYGYDVKDSVLRITLLRGPEWPDPDADRGRHEFTYSLLPHVGDWRQGETVRRAWELNSPMVCRSANRLAGSLPAAQSFVQIAGPAVLETLKPADDGDGWILRLYEPNGSRGKVTVTFPAAKLGEVTACNLVEEPLEPQPSDAQRFSFDIRPFQIRTFRLHRE